MEDLERDIRDLLELVDARRCEHCGRYYLVGYLCNHCHYDNSAHEMDAREDEE